MSGGGIFSIGLSGLNAAQAGLTTTSHNIANVGTEGYRRQTAILDNRLPRFTGAGFFGQGVDVSSVRRSYSEFLNQQVLAAETQQSYLDAFASQASQIDALLADAQTGLSPALQDFFSGVQDVATNPSSIPSRQSMLSSAQTLVSRFESLDARMTELAAGTATEIRDAVGQINDIARQIARLNQQLVTGQSTEVRPANDLLDQRDKLVADLNKIVRTQVVTESDGSYNVFIGTGQNLVVGSNTLTLAAVPSADDPQSVDLVYRTSGVDVLLPPQTFEGGRLGGLLAFRDGALSQAQTSMGRLAITLADSFNAQSRLGQDLNGALGQDFFATPVPQVQARTTNAGNGQIGAVISDVSALRATDYRVTAIAGGFVIENLADSTSQTFATLPQTVDGVDFSVASGTPAVGDSFLVRPTRFGARDLGVAITDPALVAAAAPVRSTAALANTGNAKIGAGVVTSVANLPLPGNVTFTYDRATNQFNVTGAVPAAGPFAYTSGQTIAFNGLEFTISGSPDNGDTFTVSNNTAGVADPRNALLLAKLQTSNTVGGNATYQGAYSQIVSAVGNSTREAQIQGEAQDALARRTREAERSFSGVNLDEEAANLVRYQQAYQASAKVLATAASLFATVLDIFAGR
jgi:flagellar hook-associated protein 1 FlgK